MGVANKFRHHPPVGDQAAQYELLRAEGLDFAMVILGECPLSEERNIALRRLDEAVMFAIASIARHGEWEKEV